MFFRLVSGMHASISAHISANYLLDEKGLGVTWGKNLTDFQHRLGTTDVRERVQNLYFAYLFVLRAVVKAGPLLQRLDYFTGLEKEDARTQELIDRLVSGSDAMWGSTTTHVSQHILSLHIMYMTLLIQCQDEHQKWHCKWTAVCYTAATLVYPLNGAGVETQRKPTCQLRCKWGRGVDLFIFVISRF